MSTGSTTIRISDVVQVYDNSRAGHPPRFVFALSRGQVNKIDEGAIPDCAICLDLDGCSAWKSR